MITYEEYCKIRDSKGLRDGDVAKIAGIQASTFSEWKKGKCTPKYEKMSKIAEALGMDYFEFVGPVGKFSSLNPKKAQKREITVTMDKDTKFVIEVMKTNANMHDQILSYAKFLSEGQKK